MPITQQDTEMHILGAGAETWEWYLGTTAANYDLAEIDAPDGWAVTYRMLDGDHEDPDYTIDVILNHGVLMAAMEKIAAGDAAGTTDTCQDECRTFLWNGPDECDFDACTADEVIQVAAYGAVVYS